MNSVWSWGPDARSADDMAVAHSLLKSTTSKMNRDPRNATDVAAPISDDDIVAFREWDYFPHFNTTSLQNGWYDKFNAVQGQGKTYYASGLNGFELVEFSIRAGQDIAQTYF
jgi:hypothetical protein